MKGELRRKQILDVSKKVFSRKGGYYETHVEEVIKEARIGKGTFYQYFKNKEDLFVSLLELFLDEWEEFVVQPNHNSDLKHPDEYIKFLIKRTILFFYENEHVCKIYLAGGVGFGPQFETYIEKFEEKMLDHVKWVIEQGITSRKIKKDLDREIAANVFLGAILRLIYSRFVVNKKHYSENEIRRMSDVFYEIAMNGIGLTTT